MTTEKFNELVKAFFKAVKERTLLVIIDSASRNDKAVFSLVSFKKKNDPSYGYIDYACMLKELGFKNYRDERSKFINYCAGRYSLYILDSIEGALRNHGVNLRKGGMTIFNTRILSNQQKRLRLWQRQSKNFQ